jgi:hypothetical protein
MNRLDKKQIFIGTILGIILSILTLILLTRNIQPLSAQQTQPQYMIFKTSREGFKFLKQNPIGGRQPAEYAPIFAQTPNEYSLGNQVATKEYVDSKSGISIIEEDIQTGVKYTISGPICAEEYGVYIYEKNGNYGEIYFTSMTGRSNKFHFDLDNSEGGTWFVNYDCGGWGVCDTIAQQISRGYYYGNQLAFLVARWNWDRVDKVYISGSGLGFTEINKNDSKIIWKTGRKFLGNNYGCGRNWSLEVRATSNYTPDQVFSSLTLPSNLAISRGNLGSGKIVRKYLGDSLIALIVNNTNETRTTVNVPLADVIQLCGDIDGCSIYFYRKYHNSNETYNIEGPVVFRYDISTKKWVMGYIGNSRARAGTDGDRNTQHIWEPMSICYFTDGEYIDGNNRGDPYIGLGLLDWNPNDNMYCYLVIKD